VDIFEPFEKLKSLWWYCFQSNFSSCVLIKGAHNVSVVLYSRDCALLGYDILPLCRWWNLLFRIRSCILGCCTLQFGGQLTQFWMNLLPVPARKWRQQIPPKH